jgi:hypothetical protein
MCSYNSERTTTATIDTAKSSKRAGKWQVTLFYSTLAGFIASIFANGFAIVYVDLVQKFPFVWVFM